MWTKAAEGYQHVTRTPLVSRCSSLKAPGKTLCHHSALDGLKEGSEEAVKQTKILESRIWAEEKTVWHVLWNVLCVCEIKNKFAFISNY